jgi:putative acetyltransferase
MYIETLPELEKAIRVYEKFGFSYLDKPLGDTGHFGCSVWMLKAL